jgi:hypothetical protein
VRGLVTTETAIQPGNDRNGQSNGTLSSPTARAAPSGDMLRLTHAGAAGMDATLGLPLLIGLIVIALLFDFLNGRHDAANAIATIVSTRVLRPHYAVTWAAFFNFIAFLFFGLHVAQTLGTGIVAAAVVDPPGDQIPGDRAHQRDTGGGFSTEPGTSMRACGLLRSPGLRWWHKAACI